VSLNSAGRCGLYAPSADDLPAARDPHELHPPGQPPQLGPGCGEFHRRCGRSAYHAFDRTPLYASLARLEAECRQAAGWRRKMRMTIAEMLLDDEVRE